jgi:adenosylcobinamide kinase/adenosylcobinamide-phosphate guanylyltransferase
MYTFVTGGYRSGRSSYALRRASELGPPPWLWLATAGDTDESVRKRIERHRRDQEAIWRTAVVPDRLADLGDGAAVQGLGAIVVDGLDAWIAAHLDPAGPAADATLLGEVSALADRLYRSPVPVVLVSGEVSLAPFPSDPHQARLGDVLTAANQILAELAAAVVLMVSGIPLRVR